jgi:hypothetical protein
LTNAAVIGHRTVYKGPNSVKFGDFDTAGEENIVI